MNQIYMDMRDISLSKEVYDKKPGLFFSIFIYGLLLLVVTALVWAYFGRLDIVVRAQGIMRPQGQTALITNGITGEVREVLFYEGQRVAAGDLLYSVNTFHLENERLLLDEHNSYLNYELASLNLYMDSVVAGEDRINGFNEIYSTQFENYLMQAINIQEGADNRLSILIGESQGLEKILSNSIFELEILKIFGESISVGTDLFKYELEVSPSEQAVNNYYQSQYNQYEQEARNLNRQILSADINLDAYKTLRMSIIEGFDFFQIGEHSASHNAQHNKYFRYITEANNMQQQIEDNYNDIAGYRMVKTSLDSNTDLFQNIETSIYKNIYTEHIMKREQLNEKIRLAGENYNTMSSLYELDLIPRMEYQIASTQLDNAVAELLELDTAFNSVVERNIHNAEISHTQLENQLDIYTINTLNAIEDTIYNITNEHTHLVSQAEMLRLNTLAGINSRVSSLEETVLMTEQSIRQIALQKESILFDENDAREATVMRLNEIDRVLSQIDGIERELSQLALNLSGINAQIDEATVRAPIEGEISVHTELTPGGFIMSGVQVLSIIPAREETLNASIYIENNDIGKVTEGMAVRYNIAALPRREFGDISGTITRISTDITTMGEVHGYFVVDTIVEDRVYYDARGNGVNLRVGMGFEAQVVVERQRILFYLLEKLNLLLN